MLFVKNKQAFVSTVDHIFSLKLCIDYYLLKGKTLNCAFINYKTSVCRVDRIALWHKLLDNSTDGNFIRISHNMYNVAV